MPRKDGASAAVTPFATLRAIMDDRTDDLFAKMVDSVLATRLKGETIRSLMSTDVVHCRPTDSLARCAQLMWEQRCGAVVVVDDERPVAMITDRDVCMAAYIQGHALDGMRVSSAMSRRIVTAQVDEPLQDAERRMRRHGVRRLPVLDREGAVVGVLSLADIVQAAHLGAPSSDPLSAAAVARTLSGTVHPRHPAR